MKPTALILRTLILLIAVVHATSQNGGKHFGDQVNKQDGKLSIYIEPITDEDDIVLVGMNEPTYRVVINNFLFSREAQFKKGGFYEEFLPEGIYDIKLKTLEGESTPFHRANLMVRSGVTTILEIPSFENEEFCQDSTGFVLDSLILHSNQGYQNKQIASWYRPEYEVIMVNQFLNVVIKYCKKIEEKGGVKYQFARLTFLNLLVEADEITFDRKKMFVNGHGSVDRLAYISFNGKGLEDKSVSSDLSLIIPR